MNGGIRLSTAYIYVLITAVAFATLEPFGQLEALAGLSGMQITALRFAIGSVILLPFSIYQLRKKHLSLSFRDLLILSGLGILCICVSMSLLQQSVIVAKAANASAANVAIIFCSNSLFTILLSALFLREKMTRKKVVSVVLCAIGLVFCADFSQEGTVSSSLLALMAAVTFSLYTVLSKKFSARFSGIIQTGISFSIGTVVLIVFLACTGTNVMTNVNPGNIPHLLYMGVIITGLAYWSFFRSMELASATVASYTFFIKPILTPFAVWVINGRAPDDWKLFVSIALIVAGSLVVTPLIPDRWFAGKGSPNNN